MRTRYWNSLHLTRLCEHTKRKYHTDDARFAVGDFVVLAAGKSTTPIFAGPLKPGKRFESHKGQIHHDSIIGKLPRETITTATINGKSDTRYRLEVVKLEDYVQRTRRIVTPIYPQDANLIVSLLDLHPEPAHADTVSARRQIEILEAGTGHGSLSLYLSRAVHAANAASPKQEHFPSVEDYEIALEKWKQSRQAVIHSIEASSKHSEHAEGIVRDFRRGQYYRNIDFHVKNVSDWLGDHKDQGTFITHAFLDLPNVQNHVAAAASAMVTNAPLVVFCPSISQIINLVQKLHKERTALALERVVELGVNGGTGGRLWDVKLVKPRIATKEVVESVKTEASDSDEPVIPAETTADGENTDELQVVCRPMVGERITGGGFLAVLRKKHLETE